jgi:photosystem II stability/assembly factor-like uncharacterized protein
MKSAIGVSRHQVPDCRKRTREGHSVLFSLLIAGLLVSASARAQSWIPVGVPGGNVRALAQDPQDTQRIYLGTAEGVLYRSDDGGLEWRRMDPGFPLRGCSLDDVVVDPRGVVFVGYWEVHGSGGGVARSTDGGRTFVLLKGIAGTSVRSLALSPSDPHVIAAGTLTGVFLSRDGGQAWARITPKDHPDLRNIESLAFDPTDPQVIYAGTWHLVWKTLDGGATWMPAHRDMIDDSDVMTLTIDHLHPQTVYATACTGIYRSTEGAMRWTKLTGIPYSSRRTRAFAQGDDNPKLLVAGTTEGLWISRDSGGTWWSTTPKDLVVNAVLVQRGGTIILGTEGAGVLRSTDRGQTWTSSNTGFSERFVFKMLFDAAEGRVVVAVWGDLRYGGVFVSQGLQGPWTRLGEGLDGRQVLSLALQGKTILAGTDAGIFSRAPEAKAWTPLRTALDGRDLHPRVAQLLALPENRLLAATSKGVLYSPDGGRSWTQPTLGSADDVSDLAVSPYDPDLIVAATPSGFFRSRDGGVTWRQVSAKLRGVTPHALAFTPTDDPVLFATTSVGLFRSRDQGASWRRVNGGIPHSDLTGIAVSPDGSTVYASDFTWGGIFRSLDGGSTWDRMPTDGLASDRVWALGIDPSAPEHLLAASVAGGLHLLVPTPIATRNSARASN